MSYTLSEGQAPTPVEASPSAPASSQPLDAAQVESLFSKVPPLQPASMADFSLPVRPIPPPSPERRIELIFPPPQSKTSPILSSPPKNLYVLTKRPVGSVRTAAELTVAFSQPMVPLTTQEDLKKLVPPIQIAPPVAGDWYWRGAQVAGFVPKNRRFPLSTEYTVTVPSGTKSVNGAILEQPVIWKFATDRPRLIGHYPDAQVAAKSSTLMMMHFNQRVSSKAILSITQVRAGGHQFPVVEATEQEVASDKALHERLKNLLAGSTVVFRTANLLPRGATVTVSVGPNIPSAEGPLTERLPSSFNFSTYGPMVAKRIPKEVTFEVGSAASLSFSNQIDTKLFKPEYVSIEPKVPISVEISGDSMFVYGPKKRGTYSIRLSNRIQDEFGQSLIGSNEIQAVFVSRERLLQSPGELVVIPSAGPAKVSFSSANIKSVRLKVYDVKPQMYANYDQDADLPKRAALITSRLLNIANSRELSSTDIDLRQWLKKDTGQLLLELSDPTVRPQLRRPERTWVQVTNLGLDTFASSGDAVVWVNDLRTGAPVAGAKVTLMPMGKSVTTDASGVAKLRLPNDTAFTQAIVEKSGDVAFVAAQNSPYWASDADSDSGGESTLRWYTITDRSPYKPGETVYVKGVLREIVNPRGAALQIVAEKSPNVHYSLRDPQGNPLAEGNLTVNRFGAFDATINLPHKMNLGYAQLIFTAKYFSDGKEKESAHQVAIPVQEFRRPEFHLSVKNEGDAVQIVGQSALLCADAQYYAGGALRNASVKWQTSASPATYSPPGWSQFSFGAQTPLPFLSNLAGTSSESEPVISEADSADKSLIGITDSNGKHYLSADFKAIRPLGPATLHVEATVQDLTRQTWSDATDLLVHPSSLYVGVKADGGYAKRGQVFPLSFIATKIDGKVAPGSSIDVELWRAVISPSGQETNEKSDFRKFTLSSGSEAVKYNFSASEGGVYHVIARIEDSAGRRNETHYDFIVEGADLHQPRQMNLGALLVVPDKDEYKPGETASVLIQSPFAPAEGLMTIWHSGLSRQVPFRLSESNQTVAIPLTEADMPSVSVQFDVVGLAKEPTTKLSIPAEASGKVDLKVSTKSRRLTVSAQPSVETLQPGQELAVDIAVTDADGLAQANAEVALCVVDQSLLSLSSYQFADPLPIFYPEPEVGVSTMRDRLLININQMLLAKTVTRSPSAARGSGGGFGMYDSFAEGAAALPAPKAGLTPAPCLAPPPLPEAARSQHAPGGDETGKGNPPVLIRSNFNALANWSPSVVTDGSGHASVKFKMPDNLTQYRIMAVAVSGADKFGLGESSVTVQLPLMAKPSAPRFLNFGDKFELPVVVHNQTDKPMNVKVVARANNAEFPDGQGRQLTVAANDRAEVRLPAAAQRPGNAEFQVVAIADGASDAAQFSLPVYTPATTEAFATYGYIDKGSVLQKVEAPSDVVDSFGGLEVSTSSTALQSLSDAFIYLNSYPFECSEQISSRIISVVMMKDMLQAFHSEGLPSGSAIKHSLDDAISKLVSRQRDDGTFGLWKKNDGESYPFVTLHVAHALLLARNAGYAVPADSLASAMKYIRQLEFKVPSEYKGIAATELRAFALYVRALSGEKKLSTAAHKLLGTQPLSEVGGESLGLVLNAICNDDSDRRESETILNYLNNHIVESSGTADLVDHALAKDYRLFDSATRANAVLLDALIKANKTQLPIVKLLKNINSSRVRGRWSNTEENAFVLIALRHYFDKYENVSPDFIAQAWLGQDYMGDAIFKGRTNEVKDIKLPMNFLSKSGGSKDLVIAKTGAGRLYYRIGLNYAPQNLELAAMDRGFSVERWYEGVNKKDDARRDDRGQWHFKAGGLVRVKLKMSLPAQRSFVALVDPIPAGTEALNSALEGTENTQSDRSAKTTPWSWFWTWNWWTHSNIRDNQVEVFADSLSNGTYEYSYVLRATTPGVYMTPPLKAEEMYSPETFGRAKSEVVVVE